MAPWNDNSNPGPWGPPSGGDDRRDGPRRPGGGGGGGPRRPGGPEFNPNFERLTERLRAMFGGAGGGPPSRRLYATLAGGAVALWAASGFYVVQPSEQAVVLTFGAFSRSETPGLRYHFPAPIERVEKVPVTELQKTDVGGSGAEAADASQMLTGDGQIIDIDFSVTWRISDAARYLFATRNPDQAVATVAESAMREVVGRTQLQPIISTARGQVQQQTRDLMQRTLDQWGAGISIVEVQIRDATPPPEVVAAFRDVQSAAQDAESSVNEANTYRNRVVNEAKGDAARITQASQAYREQAVREAMGEAARFNQIYTEYRRAPNVTRDRLYIETMQRILQSSNKVIVDGKGASAPIILPPDVFRPKSQAAPQTAPAPAQSGAQSGQGQPQQRSAQ